MHPIESFANDLTRRGDRYGLDAVRLLDPATTAILVGEEAFPVGAEGTTAGLRSSFDRLASMRPAVARTADEFLDGRLGPSDDRPLDAVVQPHVVNAIHSLPVLLPEPRFATFLVRAENASAAGAVLETVESLERNVIGSAETRRVTGDYPFESVVVHTDESVATLGEYHRTLGVELFDYPTCCVERFVDAKLDRIRAAMDYMADADVSAADLPGTGLPDEWRERLPAESRAARNEYEGAVWHTLVGYLAEDRLGALVDDPPASFYSRFANLFYPEDPLCANAVAKGRRYESLAEHPDTRRLYRVQLVRNVVENMVADYREGAYVSQHTDFFETLDHRVERRLDDLSERYADETLTRSLVDAYGPGT